MGLKHFRSGCALGVVLAMLALVGRLVSGSVAVDPGAMADTAALLAATVECGSTADAADDHRGASDKPVPDGGILSLAALLSQPAPVLTPELPLPAPRRGVLASRATEPAVRRAPARRPEAALPRGPPVLT